MDTRVAIIIPTMNRPEFILRQLRFYETVKSQHPVYLLDSSNEENANKIKDEIKQFKNLNITYQWAPPGKDHVYPLLQLVKESYCVQIGDDDLLIPNTVSDCANFLENHPDYATCIGNQVNIRFRKEDYIKPHGLIAQQTLPMGRSIEDGDMFIRVKSFWSDQTFLGFAVRRVETEKEIRNITKNLFFMGDLTEFLIMTILIVSGKSKLLDKLGQVMQISDLRSFNHGASANFTSIGEEWDICEKGLSEILEKKGISKKESSSVAKGLFVLFLAHLYLPHLSFAGAGQLLIDQKKSRPLHKYLFKKLRSIVSNSSFIKSIYYKLTPPAYVDKPESKYFSDFKLVKDFLENNNRPTA